MHKLCILDHMGHGLEVGDVQDLLQQHVKADSNCDSVQQKVQEQVSTPFPLKLSTEIQRSMQVPT